MPSETPAKNRRAVWYGLWKKMLIRPVSYQYRNRLCCFGGKCAKPQGNIRKAQAK